MPESQLNIISKKINLGMFWLLTNRMLLKMISIVSTLILVRLLTPADFGLVALAMSFYALVQLFSSFGFEATLIQVKDATDGHYSTVWTIRFLVSVIMCILTFLAAPYVVEFYNDSALLVLVRLISFLFILNSLVNPGMIRFIKEMDFKTEFKFQVIIKVTTFFVTISTALWLENYFALIIGMYTATILRVALSYHFSTFRPTFCLTYLKELFSFSKWMVINSWLSYINTKTFEVVIGYFGSTKSVGLFNVSNEIAEMPSTEIGAAINRTSYSAYSQAKGDIPLLKSLYLKILETTSLITIPTSVGIYLLAYEISHWVLGDGWESTQQVIEFVALSCIFQSLSTNHQYIYMSLGKPKLTTVINAIRGIILFSLLVPLTKSSGIVGASQALLITSIIYFLIPLMVTKYLIKLKLFDYLKRIIYHLVAALAMAISLVLLTNLYSIEQIGFLPIIILKVTFGASIFSLTLFILWLTRGRPSTCLEATAFSYVINGLKIGHKK